MRLWLRVDDILLAFRTAAILKRVSSPGSAATEVLALICVGLVWFQWYCVDVDDTTICAVTFNTA